MSKEIAIFKSNNRHRFKLPNRVSNNTIKLSSANGVVSDQKVIAEEFAEFLSGLSSSNIDNDVICLLLMTGLTILLLLIHYRNVLH